VKTFLKNNKLYIWGLLLITGTNMIIFSGIFLNRAGKPLSVITLTERELRQSYRHRKENNGLSLTLQWRVMNPTSVYYGKWSSPEWLDADKLTLLGFSIDEINADTSYQRQRKRLLTKKVFIVLEYNGDKTKEALKSVEENLTEIKADCVGKNEKNCADNAHNRLKREKKIESRLFAIDAGLDYKELSEKYYQQEKYIIAPGTVKPRYNYLKKKNVISGSIKSISVEKIHVPLEHKTTFNSIMGADKTSVYSFDSPRYSIELAYGQRHEPWIKAIYPIVNTQ